MDLLQLTLVKMVFLVSVQIRRNVDNDEFSYEITSNQLN